MIRDQFPEAGAILPTEMYEVSDIPPDEETTARFQRLRARSHLGGQYDWLARFIAWKGMDDLELAIHRDDKAHDFVRQFVVGESGTYHLVEDLPDTDLAIFRHFSFPVLDMTKVEMESEAKQQGFSEIMEQTWFCHTPDRTGGPCGLCNPCRYTREEGLGRRVPWVGVIKKVRHRLTRRFRSLLSTGV